jgi:hypothetical protein
MSDLSRVLRPTSTEDVLSIADAVDRLRAGDETVKSWRTWLVDQGLVNTVTLAPGVIVERVIWGDVVEVLRGRRRAMEGGSVDTISHPSRRPGANRAKHPTQ